MEKKIVIARIQIIKGKENDYLALATPFIELSKAETGNLVYSVSQEIQNLSGFIVYEEYVDVDAFNIHCNTQYFKSFIEQVKPLLAKEIDIQVF